MRITVSNSKQSFVKPVALSEHQATDQQYIRVWESYRKEEKDEDMKSEIVELVSDEAMEAILKSDKIPVSTLRKIGGRDVQAFDALRLDINPIDEKIWADCEALMSADKWCSRSLAYQSYGEQGVVGDLHN